MRTVYLLIAAIVLASVTAAYLFLHPEGDRYVIYRRSIEIHEPHYQLKLLKKALHLKPDLTKADSVILFAEKFKGTPYFVAGKDSCGFDCSGFVYYIFKHFGVDVPHDSRLLDTTGSYVPYDSIRKGDIIIFTGTNAKIRKPGHVGIAMNGKDSGVFFIHSSSNGGVRVSKVDSTFYKVRYLGARRVIE